MYVANVIETCLLAGTDGKVVVAFGVLAPAPTASAEREMPDTAAREIVVRRKPCRNIVYSFCGGIVVALEVVPPPPGR
jgi:hypothetical protein